ncbi:hypothetical protein RJ639_041075 [Escallonia herrerae]|uniref:Uncharacterized protein n=1 Tax=Escallonia herrerae TaxID=1293975 RepID=A0AA88WJQ5_9ASTE|nr:hypothetical protein RJ639_041075 [Escallonia herrerae]
MQLKRNSQAFTPSVRYLYFINNFANQRLAYSTRYSFLWMIRPDLVVSGGSETLNKSFTEEVSRRGRLGIGMEIDADLRRDKLEGLMRELMEGEKG